MTTHGREAGRSPRSVTELLADQDKGYPPVSVFFIEDHVLADVTIYAVGMLRALVLEGQAVLPAPPERIIDGRHNLVHSLRRG